MAHWSTKAAISLKRVKIEEKLLWRAYRNSPTLFRTAPSPTPTAPSSPRYGVRNPTQNFRNGRSYGLQIWPEHSQGPSQQNQIKKFGEKGAWVYPGTTKMFWVHLLSQERVKIRTSNFACTFTGSIGTKAHEKFREK